MERGVLIQLPFPSMSVPHPIVGEYYETYAEVYRTEIPEYFIPEADLWELPLWVAHLSGILRAVDWDVAFVDLSALFASVDQCVETILDSTYSTDWILLSPLAQNYDLALCVSYSLMKRGRRTVIGGNMAGLTAQNEATRVICGIVTPETFIEAIYGTSALAVYHSQRRGSILWIPQYNLLSSFGKRVPLLRLNASHGCLYSCTFCGDNWSRKLYTVQREALETEVAQFRKFFPETRLVYIGDKTFGQSPEAVQNLLDVFSNYPGYHFIVQTHVAVIDENLVEKMQALGVVIVELGFESADLWMLRNVGKVFENERQVIDKLNLLHRAGMRVVLNILGGLPFERPESHMKTINFIQDCIDIVWLYNLYNFVPYPLTPIFPKLRERIFDWNYAHWREDAPPVFTPYYITPELSWEYYLKKIETAHMLINSSSRP